MWFAGEVTDTPAMASTQRECIRIGAVAVRAEKACSLSPRRTPKTLVHDHEFRLCGLKQRADPRDIPEIACRRIFNNKRDLVLLQSAQKWEESTDLEVTLGETFQIIFRKG